MLRLKCPRCESLLEFHERKEYLCKMCYEKFPIVENIPILIPKSVREDKEGIFQLYRNYSLELETQDDLSGSKFISKYINLSNKVVFDMGGGFGSASLPFKKTKDLIILDISLGRLIKTKEANQDIKAICADIQTKILEENADIIFCWAVLEHLSDPIKAINLFLDYLNPNGILVVQVPVINLPIKSFFTFLFRRIRGINPHTAQLIHPNLYSTKKILNDLKKRRFQPRVIEYESVIPLLKFIPDKIKYWTDRFKVLDMLLAKGIRIICTIEFTKEKK